MSFTTRPAKMEELPVLLDFEQGVIDFERAFDVTLKEKDIIYYDLAALIQSEKAEVLVVEEEGQIIASGYARIKKAKDYLKHKRYVYLGFMFVLPECRGRGVNKLIMDDLVAWGKKKGIKEFRLEVYAENEGAVRAYEKAGFGKHLVEMRLGI